ncbi:glycoside hydrolase family 53 protein [Parvularcula dongshanensis]|uniref:Arabinogalactan endo-beta-1,4-galactanase n=1 Tax=Parvularcula dongshanensis TaxID=1173995 RepID=A0A840I7Z7_9PROT|nr:arabinogalactan endo-1,4-beta-galactosidase [Parvularcula dongshanensis]
MFGADLSYVNEMDDCGAVYRDNGRAEDPYEIFAKHGTNLVRLRLWNDPDWTEYSTLTDIKRSIRRAKDSGMAVLLDFHYSDDWADPGDQKVPAAWADLSEDALAEAVYNYTLGTLTELAGEGLYPDMVQVGNETNTEILLPGNVPEDQPIDWARNAKLLNAGILGVRAAGEQVGETPKIMLHVAQPENVEPWFDDGLAAGLLDFDVIGMSYYPKWSTRDLDGLEQTIRRLRHKFGKEVVVVETAYPFTLDGEDAAPNLLGQDSLIEGYPATLDGQRRYLTDLTQTVLSADGQGVVYWEPAWVSTGCSTRWGKGSHWENNTFFSYGDTKAHSGFDFMTATYAAPQEVKLVFKGAGDGTAYLWADFLGGRDFTLPLEPTAQGYTYATRLPAGMPVEFQLYADPALDEPLLGAEMQSLTVGTGNNRYEFEF